MCFKALNLQLACAHRKYACTRMSCGHLHCKHHRLTTMVTQRHPPVSPGCLPSRCSPFLCVQVKAMPTLNLNIAGRDFTLTPQQYVLKVDAGECVAGELVG